MILPINIISMVLLLHFSDIHSKCGETIFLSNTSSFPNRKFSFDYFYPITISADNDSYDMEMVLKEIGYRKQIPPYYYLSILRIHDYCNDLSTLVKQILDIYFYPDPHFSVTFIYASEVFVANIHPLISSLPFYFDPFPPQYIIKGKS